MMKIMEFLRKMGPGAIITATVIGPGTVTTCTLAGVNYRYVLGWALLFATVATIILQLMSSRLGIITKRGLSENVREIFKNSWLKWVFMVVVVFAIGLGNSAYQSGNMTGAVMGLQACFGGTKVLWSTAISVCVVALLWNGKYNVVEKVLSALVALMVLLFVITAIVVKPDVSLILKGLFVPTIPSGGLLIAMGLIGTTIVPHCLFMHAALAATKWKDQDVDEALKDNHADVVFNITLAGLISIAIVITGAALYGTGISVKSGLDMAKQLEPLVGSWAKYFFGMGLFAAGVTSAIAAPMSAGFAISGILGWSTHMKETTFRVIMLIVLLCGYLVTVFGANPVEVIVLAQAFNGILLPLSAITLLITMNNREVLGRHVNTPAQNVAGAAIVIVTIALGFRTLFMVVSQYL